jgi:hypothetical protein
MLAKQKIHKIGEDFCKKSYYNKNIKNVQINQRNARKNVQKTQERRNAQ